MASPLPRDRQSGPADKRKVGEGKNKFSPIGVITRRTWVDRDPSLARSSSLTTVGDAAGPVASERVAATDGAAILWPPNSWDFPVDNAKDAIKVDDDDPAEKVLDIAGKDWEILRTALLAETRTLSIVAASPFLDF